jgi:hypothetical protein
MVRSKGDRKLANTRGFSRQARGRASLAGIVVRLVPLLAPWGGLLEGAGFRIVGAMGFLPEGARRRIILARAEQERGGADEENEERSFHRVIGC